MAENHTDAMQRAGGDPGRLLGGEDPHTAHTEDANHWISVYTELLGFKHDVLGRIRDDLTRLSGSAREEVLGTDIPVMEAEAERFRRRIAFWEQRLAELGGTRQGGSGHE
jgi:hypothetical protein